MRRLTKRIQRKVMGGTVYARLYDDGSVRVRVDHPSNDAATEIAMAGTVLDALKTSYRAAGVEPQVTLLQWRDDPEPA